MPTVVDLLGDTVIDGSGESISVDRLCDAGKVVGIYFSSTWCMDRAFTPFLASFYTEFRKTDNGQRFEVVYVSGDKDKEDFDHYFGEMPWHAIAFDNILRRTLLWKKFKVRVTPTLVLVDGFTGNVITTNGRDCLSEDMEGKYFPWATKTLHEILGSNLLRGSEVVDCNTVLCGKIKAFYFSAHWCPPCRTFTPQLAAVYNKLTSDGKNFEVIFVSSDRCEASFTEYYGSMPWLAVPYKDKRIIQLTRLFRVEGIPSLVLVDENDKLICQNARFIITNDLEATEFPWLPKPFEELTEACSLMLHEAAALIFFTDGDTELIEKARQLLAQVSASYVAEWSTTVNTPDEIPRLRFYFEATESDEIADTLRSFAQLDNRKPLVVILDPTEQKVYTLPECTDGITLQDINNLIDEFKTAAMSFNPLALLTQ